MKKYGTIIALALAVIFGVIAVVLVNKWLSSKASQTSVGPSTSMSMTEIVVAATNINIGTRLDKTQLALAQWPKANAPKGAFEDIEQVVGRVSVSKMSAGTPILAAELAAPNSGAGLVALIKPGMRAMAIRVDEVVGVGGFILPNTFVDVISIDEKAKRTKIAETFLRKIEVLAIAQETFIEEGKPKVVRTVTMELTPEDAELLAEKTHEGPIRLVLRNPLDEKETPPPVQKVVQRAPVRRVKPRVYTPPAPSFEVEVIRGEKPAENYQFKAK
jgi:pilus assembly protein CpaB